MRFLVIPASGEASEAVRFLRKVHLLAVRMLFTAEVPPALRAPVEQFRSWLHQMLAERPNDVVDAVASPDVLPFVLSTCDFERLIPNFRMAMDGRIPPPPAGVPLVGRVEFALADSNPLALLEAHPHKSGNALDLGGHSIEAWQRSIKEALSIIEFALPTWYDEFGRIMRRLVPVGFHAESHFSASYREAPGIAYLSLHPDPLTMAEAIVHETQHTKLNALTWLDPVLHNGQTCWTESPVRPDLRPLIGVLMAVHAFVPVALMHARLAELGHPIAKERRFEQRRAEVLAANANGLEIVRQHAQPTAIGERVIRALAENG